MDAKWNPWHGCHKYSTGCKHCYVYRTDAKYGKDSALVTKTKDFDLPVQKKKDGSYKLHTDGVVNTCFTSDFFVEDADPWRHEIWTMMKQRQDLRFFFITKRIDRFFVGLPADWGEGYDNVAVYCTVETQNLADFRLPIYKKLPIRHKGIVCSPLLEEIDISPYLGKWVETVTAAGESGLQARVCDYSWVLNLRAQCVKKDVPFFFMQTGAKLLKDGKLYEIPRRHQHVQARKANINYKYK